MKITLTFESVRDSMGCYWGFEIKEDDDVVSIGSADDLCKCMEMGLEALSDESMQKVRITELEKARAILSSTRSANQC